MVEDPIGEQEEEDDRPQRQQQGAHHHAAAKLRTQHAGLALGVEPQQSANQHERQSNEEQDNQRRKRGQDERFFAGVGLQEGQLKRCLGEDDREQEEDKDGQRDKGRGTVRLLLGTNWRRKRQHRGLTIFVT